LIQVWRLIHPDAGFIYNISWAEKARPVTVMQGIDRENWQRKAYGEFSGKNGFEPINMISSSHENWRFPQEGFPIVSHSGRRDIGNK